MKLNGAPFAPGEVGQAFDFNGYGAVNMGPASSMTLTNAGTLSARINPSSTGTGSGNSGGVTAGKEGEYLLATFSDGAIQWAFANANPTWGWHNTGYVAPLGQWTLITATYDYGA